jgi:hypothetical protein
VKAVEGLEGILVATLLGKPTGRIGEDEHAETEENGGGDLNRWDKEQKRQNERRSHFQETGLVSYQEGHTVQCPL